MFKSILVLFLIQALCFLNFDLLAQEVNFNNELRGIQISKLDSLSEVVYSKIKKYKLIMIGEIHGTNEPVNFLLGVVDLLTRNGDSVQVGFEIPNIELEQFLNHRNDSALLCSDFFRFPSGDGRASLAWYQAISTINKNRKANLFFFENYPVNYVNADSVMFTEVKKQMISNSNYKTILICGGGHIRLASNEGKETLGSYLKSDKQLSLYDDILSIDHEFQEGETLWNKFNKQVTIFTKSNLEKYLYIPTDKMDSYFNGILFTRFITKSEAVVR